MKFPSNHRLADALQKMGKLHEKCAVDKWDGWKSYCFDKNASRIRNLDFEVTLDEECIQRLKGINGMGNSTIVMVKQFLQKGSIDRADAFQCNKERQAMEILTGIHGIGPAKVRTFYTVAPDAWFRLFVLFSMESWWLKKEIMHNNTQAKELYHNGVTTIQELRSRIAENKAGHFERNQFIGVECYEDFKEQMSRDEVEQIGKIVEEAIRNEFPPSDATKLEITIMGSYRRRKESCGDADILITHKDYVEKIPSEVLGNAVERLLDDGKMAFHLTFVSGMKLRDENEFHRGGYNLSTDGSKQPKSRKTRSSYMGVFNSPVVKGRRRRVDIKFYPYRERVFASIYFTGNGFFNRSIRLYATRKKGYKLCDQGLTHRQTEERVMEADTEREVFDFLGVEYKEPHERTGFDDLVIAGGGLVSEELGDISKGDFFQLERDHDKWID